jgi:hypothetical protein
LFSCVFQPFPDARCVVQGYPGTESTYCGRALREYRPIRVTSSMSMDELKGLFVQEPVDPSSFRSLVPDIAFSPQARTQTSSKQTLQDMYLHFGLDDCESSALTAQNMKQTSLHLHRVLGSATGDARWQRLKQLCQGWKIFKAFTDKSWQAMAQYLDRGNAMLAANQLRVMNTTGLSSNAKASDVGVAANYCGHCFNICTVKTPSMAKMHVGILEGTSHLYSLPVTRTSPRVTVHDREKGTESVMDMPEFLTNLCSFLMRSTLVINSPNGDVPRDFKGGWPLDVKISGWLARTMVMCTLDSDPNTPLSFYNRVMYVNWPCTTVGQGCMPVTEGERGSDELVAGCHPFRLVNTDLRGVNAALDEAALRRMKDVMDEATPPMVRESVVQELASMWIPCRPLETINAEARDGRFNRVSFMESPCAPEYLSIIFEAKRRLAEEVNRINGAKSNSDGIRCHALLEGLSATICADVPDRDIPELTIVASMKTALSNIGYPTAMEQ